MIKHVSDELVIYRKATTDFISIQDINLRLQFIKYILTEANTSLKLDHAVLIWEELVLTSSDLERELALNWFRGLMGDESDLDSQSILVFFIGKILKLDAASLTQAAVDCFSSFFGHIMTMSSAGLAKLKGNDYLLIILKSY